ncbi:MAG: hypothetical protein IJA00_01815 [Bacteroidaceae bacterium]|nr:hypothetical protein [Bacteroidaceae bacterium]MBQ6800151.1 hypothetical protein [Bacteroidaceae bacterium]
MKNSKFLQKAFFLLAAGITLFAVQACEEKDEPVLAPSIDREDMIESIDLGLPSGTLWASCNIGASSPEEYGDYFAWGETTVKDDYSWQTYQWCNGTYESMSTDCVDSIELSQQYDAALAKWGNQWRMPTMADFKELTTECTWTWTTQNGVKGYEVKGTNGNSIFLPAAGCRRDGTVLHGGNTGCYWSTTLYGDDTQHAHLLYFSDEAYSYKFRNFRVDGRSVRPVTDGENVSDEPEEGGDEENPSEGDEEGKDEEKPSEGGDEGTDEPSEGGEGGNPSEGEEEEKVYTGMLEGHEWVDLGLSVKWATCNIGADSPKDCGDYFAWGEVETKDNYSWETYKWCNGTDESITKYCTDIRYGTVDNKTTLDLSDDAARIKWGGTWRMPTHAEFEELMEKCKGWWVDTASGFVFTADNGQEILLPFAGQYENTRPWGVNAIAYYWSATTDGSSDAYTLVNEPLHTYWSETCYRCYGLPIRPVCE